MLLHDRGIAGQGRRDGTGRFAFTAERDLLEGLGRCTYTFMCLRWEALWLYGALTEPDPSQERRLARADPAVLALRLQAVAHGRSCRPVADWADAFAAAADLQADVLRAHPAGDGLWSPPTDTPERLTLADRSVDLLEHAREFEALTLRGQRLRRHLLR